MKREPSFGSARVFEPEQQLADWLAPHAASAEAPLIVALDGRSGVGKSTLAQSFATLVNDAAEAPVAVIIESDQFYAGGSAAFWDSLSAPQRVEHVIDWRRLRAVLKAIRDVGHARWRCFDWDSPYWDAAPVPLLPGDERCCAAPIVLVEGVYSGRRELSEVVDLRVLMLLDEEDRQRRLRRREGDEFDPVWDRRWSSAEECYFDSYAVPDYYDLVLRAKQG